MTTNTDTTSSAITIQSQALGRVDVAPESVRTACEPIAGFPDMASSCAPSGHGRNEIASSVYEVAASLLV